MIGHFQNTFKMKTSFETILTNSLIRTVNFY